LGTQLICNNGSGGGGNFLVSVDAHDASHDVVYEQHRSVGYVPTLIGVNQLLFSCTDNGMISCWDSASGESRWVERVSAGFWSSPVSDGSRLYCLDKNGKMFVLEAGSEYRLITSWDFGEPSEATPAIQEGQFFVRTESQLFCFGDRSQ
jgi:outer membrane protein assembly factor BamB